MPDMEKLWSAKDIKFLKDNYDHMGAKELADHLGRTEKAVYCKAEDLGLRKRSQPEREPKLQRPPAIYHNSNNYETTLNKYAPL